MKRYHVSFKKNGSLRVIAVNNFDIDSSEFTPLLSEYSKKDVYIKRYGEKKKIFEVNGEL